jgi:hypothetical protein
MFLQALGKYLDWKADCGELDDMYAFGRASLVAYAAWMAIHERPFLDQAQRLEHPTETWVAQDMRKSEVFKLASLHVTPAERTRLLERSQFFFEYCVRTLHEMPTKSLTRPVVLLLSNGFSHAYFHGNMEVVGPTPVSAATDFGVPERFIPQRVRAVRRGIRVAASLAIAAGLAALFTYFG